MAQVSSSVTPRGVLGSASQFFRGSGKRSVSRVEEGMCNGLRSSQSCVNVASRHVSKPISRWFALVECRVASEETKSVRSVLFKSMQSLRQLSRARKLECFSRGARRRMSELRSVTGSELHRVKSVFLSKGRISDCASEFKSRVRVLRQSSSRLQ